MPPRQDYCEIIWFLRRRAIYSSNRRSRAADREPSSLAAVGEKVYTPASGYWYRLQKTLKRATGHSRSFTRIYGNRFNRLTKECRLPLRLSTCSRGPTTTENRLVSPSLLLRPGAFVLGTRRRFCGSLRGNYRSRPPRD